MYRQNGFRSLIDKADRLTVAVRDLRHRANGDWKRPAVALISGVATVAALAALLLQFTLGPPDYGARTRRRIAKDSISGELFHQFQINDGDTLPWLNPRTGKRTLYPVERCYWTSDAKATAEPTYVILNEMLGKNGPTNCPDCGRTVVHHNPEPPPEAMIEALERGRR